MFPEKKILSIFLPSWSIDLHRRHSSDKLRKPILFVVEHRGKQLIARVCEEGRTKGVRTGMELASARPLVPEAEVVSFDGAREVTALSQLAQWAYRFSPLVAPDVPIEITAARDQRANGIHLDVTGSLNLFSGDEALMDRVAAELERFKLHFRMALTPSIGGGWALSRYGRSPRTIVGRGAIRSALLPLSARALRIDAKTDRALGEVNVRTIEDVIRIPRSSLLERFGGGILKRIDQALGVDDEPIEPIRLTVLSRMECRFEGPVQERETLVLAALDLLAGLMEKLTKRTLRPSQISLRMKPTSGPLIVREVLLSLPSCNERHIGRLIEKKIENLQFPYGIERMTLIASRTEIFSPRHTEYLSVQSTDDAGEMQLGELLDTLLEQLGSGSVLKLEPQASHIPERSFRYEPILAKEIRSGEKEKGREKVEEAIVPITDRPSLLLNIPQPIRAMATLPDGPPFWIKWKEKRYEIAHALGPERIAPEWWKLPEKKQETKREEETRDYFKVQLPGGAWLWVYREIESSRWFLHGLWT